MSQPSCRVNAKHASSHQGPAACIVKMNNKLLLMHLDSGLYNLAISHTVSNQSAQCSAHNEMWRQTGLNVEVEGVVGIQADGTWLFGCKLEAGFDGTEPPFDPAPTANSHVKTIAFVDPFSLDMYNWEKRDQFIVVRDAYIAYGEYQKSQLN